MISFYRRHSFFVHSVQFVDITFVQYAENKKTWPFRLTKRSGGG